MLSLLSNPILISVVLMCVLCLFRFNVLLSILICALVAGLLSGFSLQDSMQILTLGMQGNLKTALSYILLGAIAAAISRTNLTAFLVHFVSRFISHKKYLLIFSIALIACFSQNLVPIHIAFIPILIPPLLVVFNKLKIDRRAVACALTFGLTTPYMVLPLGFGLIFQDLLRENLNQNNVFVSLEMVSNTMYLGAICMLVGLILGVCVFYAKPREYKEAQIQKLNLDNLKMGRKEWGVFIGLIFMLACQIYTQNLPLSGLISFILMIILGGVEYKKVDFVFDEGLKIMGYVAFVMLVAAGFAEVLKQSGSINTLVELVLPFMREYKLIAIILMLLIGLLITMGIGTSFGTIPIIATLFCPLCLELGFSYAAIIFIIGIAGALGDAGSPASETTLGVSVGLKADTQADHIKDVCIPTFICFNGSLLVIGSIITLFL
ncbi:sodium:proton antiporter [Campylobacter sp. MIT 19-121]|uniref:Na+/H+ antiporter NhaC family protein n=1 Tax=Campylobacter sp. MIT 19-121 TaxID=2703906 RepID=UPI001389F4D1|nr:Na+/H+ antiporter NhaC family protein [Campylobacter sp. MIT 19-121]NDJ27652.1 sodium:proton antiporter [Campylobacter sp. MIT 19-121]